jgi:hypothetical protein
MVLVGWQRDMKRRDGPRTSTSWGVGRQRCQIDSWRPLGAAESRVGVTRVPDVGAGAGAGAGVGAGVARQGVAAHRSQMRVTVSNRRRPVLRQHGCLRRTSTEGREARNASGQAEIGPSQIVSFALSVSCWLGRPWHSPELRLACPQPSTRTYRALPSPCRRVAASPCHRGVGVLVAARASSACSDATQGRYLLLLILHTRPWPLGIPRPTAHDPTDSPGPCT